MRDEDKTKEQLIAELRDLRRQVAAFEMIGSAARPVGPDEKQNPDRFRLLYEEAPLPYQSLDENGNFIDVNLAWLDSLGYNKEEVLGRNFADFLHPDWKSHFKENFPRFKAAGQISGVEFEMAKKDGSTILVSFHGKIGRNPQGQFRQTHCVFQNITERRRADEALRESRERLEFVLKGSQLGFWDWNLDTNEVIRNDRWAEMLGYELQDIEFSIRQWIDFIHPDDRSMANQSIQDHLEGRTRMHKAEYRMLTRNGKYRWILDQAQVVKRDSNGRPIRMSGTHTDITERKQAEEALSESEEKYRRLFEGASLGIFRSTPEGKIIIVNPAYVRMFGFDSPEEVQSQANDIDHYVDPSCRDAIMRMLLNSNVPVHAENMYKRKDGSLFTGNLHAWFARDRDGKPLFIEGFVEDITERKSSEQALQNALRDAMQRGNEVSALLDGAQAVIRNKSFESAAGAIFDVCKNLVGATSGYVAMLSPDGRENEVVFLDAGGSSCTVDSALPMPIRGLRKEAYIKGKPVFHNEFPLSRFQKLMPEGHVPLDCVLFAPMIVDGKPVGVIGLANKPGGFNKNDARMASALGELCSIALQNNQSFDALKKSEERLDLAIRSANMGVWSWNIVEDKRYFDPQVFNLLGINPSTFSGGTEEFFRVVHPDDREKVRAALDRVLNDDDWYETEYRAIWRDGSVHYMKARGKLHRDETGRPKELNGTVWEVTEQKNAQEEHEKLQAQLSQSQKMESVGRLAGGVAHDFNNMLGVILGHTEIALEQVDFTQPIHADLEEIQKAALRSADLTRQLLAFARKQTISPKIIDLNETVEGMLKMLRRLIGEDIDLAWLPARELWPIKVDPSQIDQILANLCVNARDAISGTGKVTIETGATLFDNNYCARHPGTVASEFVMLAVSDNGSGIDRETQARIFEPFFTTKELGVGTGLGLATVYGIVKQNNGFINVYSEPGQGTTFKIYLPRAEEQTTEMPPVQSKRNLRGKETVLLVEDEEPMLALGKTILQRHGYEVLAAKSPSAALGMVQSYPGPIHLLVTDVVMPEMNGKDLRCRLVEVKPGLKSIFMSGYTANVIAHHGILDEGIDFLQKPFSVQTLLEKVRNVLDR